MSRASLPLRLTVATPCQASWESMKGNDRVRLCEHCQLQVYNLSALTQKAAEDLIVRSEDRLCVRLYQRADGTFMTADCPLALQMFRRGVCWSIAKAMGVGFFFLALLAGVASSLSDKPRKSTRQPAGPMTPVVDWIMDKLCPHPIMGAVVPPTSSSNGGCNGMEEDCPIDDQDDLFSAADK